MTFAKRIQVGIAQYGDGWSVILTIDGKTEVHDPPFPSEALAEKCAKDIAAAIRKAASDSGARVE